jgi:hypothetical protein
MIVTVPPIKSKLCHSSKSISFRRRPRLIPNKNALSFYLFSDFDPLLLSTLAPIQAFGGKLDVVPFSQPLCARSCHDTIALHAKV